MSLAESFLRPDLWPVLLLVPAAAAVQWGLDRYRRRRRVETVGPRLRQITTGPGRVRLRWRRGLAIGALALSAIALLGPTWGEGTRTTEQRGVDVLVCLDVSRSMLARDMTPDRLAAAKTEIRSLAEVVDADRLGLVVFAGEAALRAPLTRDHATFVALMEGADPEAIGRGGTDLGAALTAALEALEGATGDHEAVLLLTDGEDIGGRGAKVAEVCREANITVHAIGFGSPRGAKIAIPTEDGEAYLKDRDGREVISVMDPESLRRVAAVTGGEFVDAITTANALAGLYRERILPMARKAFEEGGGAERENRFQWFLIPALLAWCVAFCLGRGGRRRV